MEDTKKLTEFCHGLAIDMLPAEVIEKAKHCLLDYVANVYGSTRLDAVIRIAEYIESLGDVPQSSVHGFGFRASINNAAFLNGTSAEAIEAQDGLRFGGNHPGTAVIPAALATAEQEGSSGGEILCAIVAGYEAANRIAAAMHPYHTLGGFLPTGTCGTFGAAVAAARLKKLDLKGMLNAVGIAGYLAPVSMAENLMGGFTSKIVQGGQAASAGLTATGLAAVGMTGPPYVVEGSALNGGFAKITTNAPPDMNRLTEALGEKYSILDIYIKPFTSCRHTHAAAEATKQIVDRAKPAIGDIESVEVKTYAIAAIAVSKAVETDSTFVRAQFSIPYVVSAILLDGTMGPQQLAESRISDPKLIELSKKVKISVDQEITSAYPDKTGAEVIITLKNGDNMSHRIDIPSGDPRKPMSVDDIITKIRDFDPNRKTETTDKIIDAIMKLETLERFGEIISII